MGVENSLSNEQILQLKSDLQNSDQQRQLQAVKVAGKQKISQLAPIIIELLEKIKDPYHPLPRQLLETSIWTLGEIGDPQAIPSLIKLLDNVFYKIQASAAIALASIGAEEAVGPIWQLIKDENTPQFVKISGIEALGKIGNQEARDCLRELVENVQYPQLLKDKASQMLHYIQGFW